MFDTIKRFASSFAIGKLFMTWFLPVVILTIIAAIASLSYYGNKELQSYKTQLIEQGKMQGEIVKLREVADKLQEELETMKASQKITEDALASLQQDMSTIQKAARIRQVTVTKKVQALRSDSNMDALEKEKAISRVYAQSLRESQCRILPDLCKEKLADEPAINAPSAKAKTAESSSDGSIVKKLSITERFKKTEPIKKE